MSLQQVLVMETRRSSMRSEVVGWTYEDPSLVKPGAIGMSPSWSHEETRPLCDCVLRALAEGWRLLGPPISTRSYVPPAGETSLLGPWEWWLVREKQT